MVASAWLDFCLPIHGEEVAENFWIVREPVQLHKKQSVDAFIAAVKPFEARMIVIDTFARCFVGGDENSATEMGLAVEGAERISRETGAVVLLVHHTIKAKSAKRPAPERGSSALRGGTVTMIRVEKSKNALTLTCDRQKDGEEFPAIAAQLQILEVAPGESSCAVVVGGEAAASADEQPLGGNPIAALRVLANAPDGLAFGEWCAGTAGEMGGTCNQSTFRHWRDRLRDLGLVESSEKLWRISERGHLRLPTAKELPTAA